MHALKSSLGEDSETYMFIMKFAEMGLSQVDYINRIAGKGNVTLYDIMSGQPKLMEIVMKSLEHFPGYMETTFKSGFKGLMKLLELYGNDNMENYIASVCMMTDDTMREIFETEDVEDIDAIRDLVCEIVQNNETREILMNELLALTTYGPYVELIEEYARTGDKTLLQRHYNDTEFARKVNEFITNYQKLLSGQMGNIQLPKFDTEKLVMVFNDLYTKVDPNDMNNILPLMMAGMAPLYANEEIWNMFTQYSEAMTLVLDYISDITSSLDIRNGTLELAGLFMGGADSWKSLLEGSLALQPQMVDLLMGVSIRLDKVNTVLLNQIDYIHVLSGLL